MWKPPWSSYLSVYVHRCSTWRHSAHTWHWMVQHRSHYSNNEIIMNAAARLHQRNIYCIIYSVPWFRENTYKLLATLFPLHKHTHTHTHARLPFKAVPRSCWFSLCFSRPQNALAEHLFRNAGLVTPDSLKGLLVFALALFGWQHLSSAYCSDGFLITRCEPGDSLGPVHELKVKTRCFKHGSFKSKPSCTRTTGESCSSYRSSQRW